MKEYTIGTTLNNGWIITEEIGSGAAGTVYKIEKNIVSVKTVSALKVIRIPSSQAAVKQAYSEGMNDASVTAYFQGFVDEILKEVKLMDEFRDHPNIVGYQDSEIIKHEDGIGWDILIRMELLTPLDTYLLTHNMNEKEVIHMGLDLTNALNHCHKKGVIHRDIKPANIFRTEKGVFKLGDFGIAKTVEKTTGGLSKKGTESYMAPEVYLLHPYGKAADQYSLGLVLYSCMNQNRLPFLPPYPQPITFSQREEALAKRMQGETLPKPSQASEEFSKVILKACNYDPQQRYSDVKRFHNALNALIPKKAEETPPPVPKVKKSKNRKIPVAAIVGVVCVFAVMGLFIAASNLFPQNGKIESTYTSNTDVHYQNQFNSILEPLFEDMCYVNGVNWKESSLEQIGSSLEGDYKFKGDDGKYSDSYTYQSSSSSKLHKIEAYSENNGSYSFVNGKETLYDFQDDWTMREMEWKLGKNPTSQSISVINTYFPDAGFKMSDQKADVLKSIGITQDMITWVENEGQGEQYWSVEDSFSLTSVNSRKNGDDYWLILSRDGACLKLYFRSSGELYNVIFMY